MSCSITLRPHDRYGVSNYWQLDCFFNNTFRLKTIQLSKHRSTGYLGGPFTINYYNIEETHFWLFYIPCVKSWYKSPYNISFNWFTQAISDANTSHSSRVNTCICQRMKFSDMTDTEFRHFNANLPWYDMRRYHINVNSRITSSEAINNTSVRNYSRVPL